jgi:hypothetical protein
VTRSRDHSRPFAFLHVNSVSPRRTTQWLTVCAVIAVASAGSATAQESPGPAIEMAAGALIFADDGRVTEGGIGGASRFYVSPRVSIGPEIVFVSGKQHTHLILTGNATFDLIRPVNGTRRITPFLVAGAGMFHTRERFPNSGVFTHTEGAFTAGGGIRGLAGEHLFVGAEARVGWELHLRINGLVGIRFGG